MLDHRTSRVALEAVNQPRFGVGIIESCQADGPLEREPRGAQQPMGGFSETTQRFNSKASKRAALNWFVASRVATALRDASGSRATATVLVASLRRVFFTERTAGAVRALASSARAQRKAMPLILEAARQK